MADNETSYLPIGTCLEQIEKAVYGREVRQAIHDGIAQCYDDTVEGVNAAQQAASDTQDVIDNAVTATNRANTAAAEASNVKVEQTVSGDTVTFTTTKRDGTTVSTSFQKPNIVVSKDEGSGEFSVTAKGWNGEEIIATIPDPSEEVKSRATIAAVSKVKTALGNPLTITDGMDAPAVKTVVTLEPKQDLHGYDHPWVGGCGKNKAAFDQYNSVLSGITVTYNAGAVTLSGTSTALRDFSTSFSFSSADRKLNLPAGEYIISIDKYYDLNAGGNILYLTIRNTSTNASRFVGVGSDLVYTTTIGENEVIESAFIRVASGTVCSNVTIKPMIALASESDGTFEPYSNICPIEGYDTVRVTATGKNLYTDALKILSHSIDANGTYNYDSNGCVTEYIPVKGADVIKWGVEVYPAARGRRLHAYDQYGNWLRQLDFFSSVNDGNRLRTVTLPDDVAYVRVSLHVDDVYVFIYTDQSITGFIKDEGSTTSLSVAQAAGATVYGGTVTLNEDGSGTLVVDRLLQEYDGTENWVLNTNGYGRFYLAKKPAGVENANNTNNPIFKSNIAKAQDLQTVYGSYFGVGGAGIYFNKLNADDTLEAFIARLTANHAQVVWPLATASSYSLTASQLRTLTGKNHVWTDGTKLELTYRADKYADVEKFLNAIPTGTKTGAPAVFADGADDLPFEKLTIAVEPHQEGSGDPSPDNVRPITGWDEVKVTRCGKNLFDPNVEDLTSFFGTVSRYGHKYTKTGQYTITVASDGPNTYYKVCKTDLSDFSASAGFMVSAGRTLNPTVAEGQMMLVYVEPSSISKANKIFVALGRNVEYEDYIGSTLPISLKYATGSTVYGGTVTINRDGTGSVVVDRAKVTLTGIENWKTNSVASGLYYLENMPYKLIKNSGMVISDKFAATDIAGTSLTVGQMKVSGTNVNFKTQYETVDDWKNALSTDNVTVCYETSTTDSYTLTAPQLTSLLGNNTVWCDAGQVTVKYKRDIGKALDAMVASLIEAGLYVDMGAVDVVPGA